MKRQLGIRKLMLVGLAVVLTGCATSDEITGPSDPTRGMIIGRFDYTDSKYIVTAITMDPADRISIRSGMRGERVHVYNGGVFFADDLTPGKYQINALLSGNVIYTPPANQKMVATVRPGEIRYMGTYKLRINEPKLFSRTGGSMTRTDRNPNERQLLEEILVLVKGTGWEPRIKGRIRQLKRSK
jgi:hypothetical protein